MINTFGRNYLSIGGGPGNGGSRESPDAAAQVDRALVTLLYLGVEWRRNLRRACREKSERL